MNYALLIILIISSGCASYQSGNYADIVSGTHPSSTPITGNLDSALTTEHFALINFSFGNMTKEWLRVKKVRLDFRDENLNKKVNVVVGQDLVTWAEAINYKRAIDQWNKQIILGTIALAGNIVANIDKNSPLGHVGATTDAFASGMLAGNIIVDTINDLERAKLFPQTHLYQPFSVPAGLYTNRWILLQIKKEDIPSHVYFDVEYLDGKKAKYSIRIKN